jgi:hypothetical protein
LQQYPLKATELLGRSDPPLGYQENATATTTVIAKMIEASKM